jgi:hypothetical protein
MRRAENFVRESFMHTTGLVILLCALPFLGLAFQPPKPAKPRAVADDKETAAHVIVALASVPYLIDLAWQIPLGSRVSWATTNAPNPDAARSPARIFLVRGTGTVFSPGFGDLCTALRRQGLWTEDLGSAGDGWVRQYLIAEKRAGRLQGSVVLVGHSRGGRHILETARDLQKAGITIDLLVCLDVAAPPQVPSNVHLAINLFATEHRLYPAAELKAASSSETRIENINLNSKTAPLQVSGLTHVSMTAHPAVQRYVVQRILETVQARGTGPHPLR